VALTPATTDESTATRPGTGTGVDAAAQDAHLGWVRKLGERPTTEQAAVSRDTATTSTPRPRASVLASVAIVGSVIALLAVMSGMLIAPGVALGVVSLLFAFGGFSATSRRHVVGRTDATVALLLGIAAIVLGVLSLTGNLAWLTSGSDKLTMVHDWLQAHASWSLLP
jgi:hypothetical protein